MWHRNFGPNFMQALQEEQQAQIEEARKFMEEEQERQALKNLNEMRRVFAMRSKAMAEKIKMERILKQIENEGDQVTEETKNLLQKDCPVCFQFMVEPVTLNACMHRFCITCINNIFSRDAKKSCPMCRIQYKDLTNKSLKLKHIDQVYCGYLKKLYPEEYNQRHKEMYKQGLLLCDR